MIDLPPTPSLEQLVQNVAVCGVPSVNITPVPAGPTSLAAIRISRVGETTPEKLRCIAAAAGSTFVHIDDEVQNLAYWELQVEDGRARAREEADTWLSARGLLATLPRYSNNGTALGPLLRAVERHCGVDNGPALDLIDVGGDRQAVQFNPALLDSLLRGGAQPMHFCLSYSLIASGLPEAEIQVPSLPVTLEVPDAE